MFPPLIGLMSGTFWKIAIIGLAISAILFPIATIIAVDNMGGTVQAAHLLLHGLPGDTWLCGLYLSSHAGCRVRQV